MNANQATTRVPWLPLGVGLVAGLALAELLAISMSYPTPLVDLMQAMDFALG